jgi:protein O-mannosyl-transferase
MLAAGLIALAALAAYWNSFRGVFVFDDHPAIVENQTIRQLWPIGTVLSPPANGETVSGRPLLNLSLAVNYALGGLDVWGYHAVNLGIHILVALVLFGILRRTLLLPAFRQQWGRAAMPLALATALLWVLHPLQTESVTYIAQRAESLAALFYVLVLYCVLRGAESTHPCGWYAVAVAACLLGMASKETVATAPLLVLVYDRTFLAGSFRKALRQRWALYLALAATWALLGYLMVSTGLAFPDAAAGVPSPSAYARSQPGVILYYLRLSVWPHPLCLDYSWPVAETVGEILPAILVVAALVGLTLWGLVRWNVWGFLGVWFFLILAPTSSVFPLSQLAFEHRMYLPLAAVTAAVVLAGCAACRAVGRAGSLRNPRANLAGGCLVGAIAIAFGILTTWRNADYRNEFSLWQDTVAKAPHNPRALTNLGIELAAKGQRAEAITCYQKALENDPDFVKAHVNLGLVLYQQGRTLDAMTHWYEALSLRPTSASALNELAWVRATNPEGSLRDGDEAVELAQRAVQLPGGQRPEVLDTLAAAYAEVGRFAAAVETAEHARAMASARGDAPLANRIGERIRLYRAQRPFRDWPPAPAALPSGELRSPKFVGESAATTH